MIINENAMMHRKKCLICKSRALFLHLSTQFPQILKSLSAAVRLFDYVLYCHDQFAPFYPPADGILLQTGWHADGPGFKKLAVQDHPTGSQCSSLILFLALFMKI